MRYNIRLMATSGREYKFEEVEFEGHDENRCVIIHIGDRRAVAFLMDNIEFMEVVATNG